LIAAPRKQQLPILTGVLAVALAAGWLLPFHHQPWPAFYTDAWVSIGLMALFWLCLFRVGPHLRVSGLGTFTLALCGVPLAHWGIGLVPLASDAWVSFAYLLGFALAIILGEFWSQGDPHAAADLLFVAVALAGIISVAVQIVQWTDAAYRFDVIAGIVMQVPPGARPYANLGQPNQLATLQLWGVLALLWAWRRGAIRARFVGVGGVMLVFGLALTQSRTGWLAFFVLIALSLVWRQREFGRELCTAAMALYALYLVLLLLQPSMGNLLGLPSTGSMADRLRMGLGTDLRWDAWSMFLQASFERPWAGYGWGHTREAMVQVIADHPRLAGTPFAHAHMLPLDLVLWLGWPLGLLLMGAAIWWLVMQTRRLQTPEQALVFAALVVVGTHAMLELPLHYAYLLLPTGILMGVLNTQAGRGLPWFQVSRHGLAVIALCASALLALIVWDYWKVERAFERLQQPTPNREQAIAGPASTWLLHHWHEFLVLAHEAPRADMSDAELAQWYALVMYFPAPNIVDKYMHALELNGRTTQLAYLQPRLCALMDRAVCGWMTDRWAARAVSLSTPSTSSRP
jgi:hypothetical protein